MSKGLEVLGAVFLVAIIVVVLVVIGAIQPWTRGTMNMPGEIAEAVLDGDNAIANYEWFKSQEAFIRQCLKDEELTYNQWQDYLVKLPEDITEWTPFMNKEESGLRASYNAHQKLTNKALEDYNAKASMVHKSIFKDLPTNIVRSAEDAFLLVLGD